ncbi:MAG TPA: OadG family transporter subunit [Pseudohaliea sp.]|nr:OadG family transporter subunit [Pseudohaliea sp.]
MEQNLLQEGLDLMLFGMLTVVLFLSLLVLATSALSALVQRFAPPAPVPVPPQRGAAAVVDPAPAVVAAIAAAIARHRHVTSSQKEQP